MVNTAAFTVTLYEEDFPLLEMRAVVGRPDEQWATPSFAAPIRSLVLNPSWNVPESIARTEILPRLITDPDYLERAGLEAVAGRDRPASVDVAVLPELLAAEERLPFRLRQPAGPGNALGRIKLKMSNPFDIYLHDTPDRALFSRRNRALSHGCIRIEQPLRLAELLLGEGWGGERLPELIDAGESLTLALPEPVPVHVAYLTAWVDADGTIHFRDDLYGRDENLIALFDDGRIELASNVN